MLPVEERVKYYLKQYGLCVRRRESFPDGIVGDIVSGKLYNENRNRGYMCDHTITILICADGANPYEKSKYVFWPFTGVINEAPYSIRRSNVIVFALFYGDTKPSMEIFFKQCRWAHSPWNNCNYGRWRQILCKTIDCQRRRCRQCRPPVATYGRRNTTQFNGYFGCDFCLHPGDINTMLWLWYFKINLAREYGCIFLNTLLCSRPKYQEKKGQLYCIPKSPTRVCRFPFADCGSARIRLTGGTSRTKGEKQISFVIIFSVFAWLIGPYWRKCVCSRHTGWHAILTDPRIWFDCLICPRTYARRLFGSGALFSLTVDSVIVQRRAVVYWKACYSGCTLRGLPLFGVRCHRSPHGLLNSDLIACSALMFLVFLSLFARPQHFDLFCIVTEKGHVVTLGSAGVAADDAPLQGD